MWLITSMGEMSAARTTRAGGRAVVAVVAGDLRRALTTSFTPRLRVRCAAAEGNIVSRWLEDFQGAAADMWNG